MIAEDARLNAYRYYRRFHKVLRFVIFASGCASLLNACVCGADTLASQTALPQRYSQALASCALR